MHLIGVTSRFLFLPCHFRLSLVPCLLIARALLAYRSWPASELLVALLLIARRLRAISGRAACLSHMALLQNKMALLQIKMPLLKIKWSLLKNTPVLISNTPALFPNTSALSDNISLLLHPNRKEVVVNIILVTLACNEIFFHQSSDG